MSLLKRLYASLLWQKQFLPSQLHKPWFKLIKPDTCLCKIIWLISASRKKYKLWSEKILIWYCDVWVLIPKHLHAAKSSFHLNKSPKIYSTEQQKRHFSETSDIFIFFYFFPPQETVFTSLQAFLRVTSRSYTGRWLGRHAGGRRDKVPLLSK